MTQEAPKRKPTLDEIKQVIIASAIMEVVQNNRSEVVRIAQKKLKEMGIELSPEDLEIK